MMQSEGLGTRLSEGAIKGDYPPPKNEPNFIPLCGGPGMLGHFNTCTISVYHAGSISPLP